ncbi:granulocyte-macrophage colony-stimulating factor receptor subunit alpha isoform X3 [Alligator mississippiensis]|uniref:Granulocyte-macrophage colony-stimulating factor receptor subunit alpha isoform A n=1 Tax=Alligator mississippiensis TaxID=8496 RepID=A0A151NW99_ALLMI|nr:granulocyte-macrophage colony-stimulating factor receptor subunit alpha isoform X3 [Alligator mississippiensis]KYO41146.1 granulocyte-macrophage colony-stimulating factor receptor subunit alpha isoform A [Alligator mississippiensis]
MKRCISSQELLWCYSCLFPSNIMVITLGVSAMIWCILPFHPVHATIQCTHSNETTSPITNLTVNLKKLELTWDSSLNFTKYQCTLKTKNSSVEKKENKKNCIFSRKPIHEGAIFRVEGNYDMVSYSSECTFIPEGLSGTSVENFACVIYNVSFMNCTWTPGRNTPEDTQYFLYQKFSKEGERQCQHYIKDAHGRHTGCRFQDVVIKDNNVVYFLVNGSSKESKIQFYDEYITLYEIELLTTPTNITVNCEEPPRCIVEWEPPRRSQRKGNQCFQYNIDIQRKTAMADPAERRDDSPTIVNENTYRFENFNAKKKHFLKIRARGYNCPISENWGEWSETIEFGNEESVSLTIIVLIFILGTVTVALLVLLLSKRYCKMRSFFPPIPQPKNKFSEPAAIDSKIQREFETSLIKYETEEVITTVEEISPFPKAN